MTNVDPKERLSIKEILKDKDFNALIKDSFSLELKQE